MRIGGKPQQNYVVFAMALTFPLLILYALYRCIRAPVRRKKRWLLFIAFGVGTVTLNWTTGEVGYAMFNARLLGMGFTKQNEYAPWMFAVALPLGAILFLLKQREGARPLEAAAPPEPEKLDSAA